MDHHRVKDRYSQDAVVQFVQDRRSFEIWAEGTRQLRAESNDALQAFSGVLAQLFLFLGDGYSFGGKRRQRVIGMRAWVLVYALRPDLVSGESMTDAAKAFGVTRQSMQSQLEKLRRYFPALEIRTECRRGREGDRALSSVRMQAMRERQRLEKLERFKQRVA